MIIIVMGVSGSGKTTVGGRLAGALGWPFYEGDDFHPPRNVEKMRQGIALTDIDRVPWLARLGDLVTELLLEGHDAVITCSALKKSYRDALRANPHHVKFVYLQGSYDVVYQRLTQRRGHYAGQELLDSQFEALEEPHDAITVDINQQPDVIVARIRQALGQ